jgi:hypothetical protein
MDVKTRWNTTVDLLVLELVAGAVRESKSDIVLSTVAVSLDTECEGHIARSAIGQTRARVERISNTPTP